MGYKSDELEEGYTYDIVFNYEKHKEDPINLVIYKDMWPTGLQINCSKLKADHPHEYFMTGSERRDYKSVRLKYTIMDGPPYDDRD